MARAYSPASAECKACGAQLAADHSGPCPNCGQAAGKLFRLALGAEMGPVRKAPRGQTVQHLGGTMGPVRMRRGRAKGEARLFGGRWKKVKRLGGGGQGTTFIVTDERGELPGQHVLKLLHRPGKKAIARFDREVSTLRTLAHPQIVRIVDAVLDQRERFYVMPYYPSRSLDEHKERWQGKPADALRFFESLCETLAAAHRAGVTHRDIKPANILLDDHGLPVLADFGICYVEDGERRTLTDEPVGARKYIAPELEEGRVELVSPASDVYSLGKVVHWMLSGGHAFTREHRYFSAPDSLDALFPHDDRYRQVTALLLRRSVTASPGSRFPNAGEFAAEVRRVADLFEAG